MGKRDTRAIAIQTDAGICYANLESGAATGAVNVDISGTTYHTVE
jgi:hypothetical protein